MASADCPICHLQDDLVLWDGYASDLWPELSPPDFREEERTACEACEKAGRCLPADPARQNTGGFDPVFTAYCDQKKRCDHCGCLYLFSAAEQRHWYEELGFTTRSIPRACPGCRRQRRAFREGNARHAERLKTLDLSDPLALLDEAGLLLGIGFRNKALQYLRRAKNLASAEVLKDRLRQAFAAAQAAPEVLVPGRQFASLARIDSATSPERLRETVDAIRPFLAPEGLAILEEVQRRWTTARYGDPRPKQQAARSEAKTSGRARRRKKP